MSVGFIICITLHSNSAATAVNGVISKPCYDSMDYYMAWYMNSLFLCRSWTSLKSTIA